MICLEYKIIISFLLVALFAQCKEKVGDKEKNINNEYEMNEKIDSVVVEDDVLDDLERMYESKGLAEIVNWADTNFMRGKLIIFPPGKSERRGIISNREVVKVDEYFKPTEEYILEPLPTQEGVLEETFSTWVVPYVKEPFAVRIKVKVEGE